MPVGPEFQDPPEELNQVPYFVAPPGGPDGSPFYEQTVNPSAMQQFVAVVGDANIEDTLTARWVANYPPITSATALLYRDMSGERTSTNPTWAFKLNVTCSMFRQGADPNLVIIVSDRGFIDTSVDPASHSQEPYNYAQSNDQGSQFVATMIGWRITGCQ